MAATPSHVAAALPLKLWRPRWFDGVALVIGSMAPDLGYPLFGLGFLVGLGKLPTRTHLPPALLWWCLPVTLALSIVVRLAAPTIAAHLPSKWLALNDFGVVGRFRHRWYVTVWSALLGAATHLFWDGFTHDPGQDGGWATQLIPFLRRDAYGARPWWWVLQVVTTVIGAVVVLGLLRSMARARLLVAWHGPAPDAPRSPRLFWPVCIGVLLAYGGLWPILPYKTTMAVQVVRAGVVCGIGLLAGAAAVWLRARAASPDPTPGYAAGWGDGVPHRARHDG